MIHLATLKPKPDIAPKRAAIVGIRQTTARKPSQLKKKAIILLNRENKGDNENFNLQCH